MTGCYNTTMSSCIQEDVSQVAETCKQTNQRLFPCGNTQHDRILTPVGGSLFPQDPGVLLTLG